MRRNCSLVNSLLAVVNGIDDVLITLVRLMRALTSHGIFMEVDKQTYKHNQMSIQYTIVSVRDLVKHLFGPL